MDRFKIILSVMLITSALLNVRLYSMFSNSHDDFVLSISNSMHLENEVLQNIERGNLEAATSALTESIGSKAVYVGICVEHECISKSALAKLNAKP
jgi:hypothetical protein